MFLSVHSAMAGSKIVLIGGGDAQVVAAHLREVLELADAGIDQFEVVGDQVDNPKALDGVAAVMIMESISSGNVAGDYSDAPIPVISNEAWTWDDMKFVDGGMSKDQDDTIVIQVQDHPITEGFDAEITVRNGIATLMAAQPFNGDAQILATVKSTGNPCLVVYEKSAAIKGYSAPARRVAGFVFADTPGALTDDGWALVDRMVFWALGLIGMDQDVSPADALPVTWSALKSGHL
jgi:hypothetical protein